MVIIYTTFINSENLRNMSTMSLHLLRFPI